MGHLFHDSSVWCEGGGSVPETTYIPKDTIRVPEQSEKTQTFSFGTIGDLFKGSQKDNLGP